jgi:transposase
VSAIKKTLSHPKANDQERTQFQETIKSYHAQGKSIVYIDESGFAHDMPRTHGYTRKGLRCYGKNDWGAKGRTNVIGALLGKMLLCVSLFNCNVDSDVFHAWVTQQLLSYLPTNTVIVMDNATFHKRADTREAIISEGHILEFLPPYSPDLNPIEQKWAQAKSIRKKYHYSIEETFLRQNL